MFSAVFQAGNSLPQGAVDAKKIPNQIKSKREWTNQQERSLFTGCQVLGHNSWLWDGAKSRALRAHCGVLALILCSPWKGAGGHQYRQGTGTGRSLIWPKVACRPCVRKTFLDKLSKPYFIPLFSRHVCRAFIISVAHLWIPSNFEHPSPSVDNRRWHIQE